MLGEIISAGANLIGGILGNNQEEENNKRNIQLQKDFAQQGVRWKVEDAKAAGLHPLAALGAQTHSFAPVSVGNSLASGISGAGQDISRAINSTRSTGERMDAYTKTLQDLQLTRAGLENELLASQIAKINTTGIPPALPSAGDRYLVEGQGNSPLVKTSAMARQASDPTSPSTEAGAVAESGFARTPTGWAPIMSKDFMDRTEEDTVGHWTWNIRNRLGPTFQQNMNPPNIPKEDGEYFIYDPVMQEYRKYKTPKKGDVQRLPGLQWRY